MEKERRRQLGGVSEILRGKLEGRLLGQLAGLKRLLVRIGQEWSNTIALPGANGAINGRWKKNIHKEKKSENREEKANESGYSWKRRERMGWASSQGSYDSLL
jgi:hypothetical protein